MSDSDSYETLDIRVEDHLCWLTLDRPKSLNAMSRQLVTDLRDFLAKLPDRHDIRVVILRGAGRAFCAGLDLKEAAASRSGGGDSSQGNRVAAGLRGQRRISELVIAMRRAPQPFIACVHGPASGGGFALALASDIRIAGESARMNAAFIRIGLSACDIGVSYFLPRLVGASLASELLLTGKFIDAERALARGLVSDVVPDDQLDAAGETLAREILGNSPLGVKLTKEALAMSLDAGSLEQVIAMEDRNQTLCAQSPDVLEGMRAFLEKRPPQYTD
ncbi:MAG: enoyl-CoA hydratase/isomerase family protein [Deltaproteobacteria bacterium]|nr:enoyl-CoA hydratase/isomerase family protein [Deltaproteobacteria bacterium]MBW2446860.1 enoyl-CoA hydratase/isomerase family protein [Deltaproteobacteria bacterium]